MRTHNRHSISILTARNPQVFRSWRSAVGRRLRVCIVTQWLGSSGRDSSLSLSFGDHYNWRTHRDKLPLIRISGPIVRRGFSRETSASLASAESRNPDFRVSEKVEEVSLLAVVSFVCLAFE